MLTKLESLINYITRRTNQVFQLISMPNIVCYYFNKVRHEIILHEICKDLKKSQFDVNHYFKYNNPNKYNSKIIWVFWWQGCNHMPNIVKKCYLSIKKESNGHKVVLITRNNVRKYTTIPKFIFKKLNKGEFSLTHFSDILRFNLLKNYGGLWIDSTIFCSKSLSNKYFKHFYTANFSYDKYNSSVTICMGRWTGFLIGGDNNNPLFYFMDDFFKNYWSHNSCLVEYFLIDYALYYAYVNNIGNFHKYVSNADKKPHLFYLYKLMKCSFNENLYKSIVNDTELFKLTYKHKIPLKKGTFYYRFMNKGL